MNWEYCVVTPVYLTQYYHTCFWSGISSLGFNFWANNFIHNWVAFLPAEQFPENVAKISPQWPLHIFQVVTSLISCGSKFKSQTLELQDLPLTYITGNWPQAVPRSEIGWNFHDPIGKVKISCQGFSPTIPSERRGHGDPHKPQQLGTPKGLDQRLKTEGSDG